MLLKRVFLLFIVVVLLLSLGCVTDRGHSNYRPSSESASYSSGYSYYEGEEPVVSEEDKQAKKAIETADAYMARGEYSKAYQTLTEVNNNYPWRSDLADALNVCEKKYADDVIRLAADAFGTDQDYDAAIAELKYAQRDLPYNEAIINEIAKYESYRPIGLDKLSSFFDDRGKLNYVSGNSISDNCGNIYSSWFEWDAINFNDYNYGYGNNSVCYRLNREYSRMTGTIFVAEKHKNIDFVGSISIYGDEKLLAGPYVMGKGSTPVSFDIDISNIVEMKICLDVEGEKIFYETRPHFANVMLYPKNDVQN
jgi:hypothetical protein